MKCRWMMIVPAYYTASILFIGLLPPETVFKSTPSAIPAARLLWMEKAKTRPVRQYRSLLFTGDWAGYRDTS